MDRLYFELEPIQNGDQIHYRARLQIKDTLKTSPQIENLTEKIALIENLYNNAIQECREIYRQIRKRKQGEKLYLYWDIGDKINYFLKQTDQEGFFLNYPKQHFSRDLGVSDRTISYLLLFRKKIEDKNAIDPSKPWSYYTRRCYRKKKYD